MTTTLQFRPGLVRSVYHATGTEFSYVISRIGKGWTVEVWHHTTVADVVVRTSQHQQGTVDTRLLAKATVRHYEANTDADTKPSQNRMTRAIGAAYDEEN